MSICQTCAREIGTCSWERDFTPVPGWKAVPTILKGQNFSKGSNLKKQIPSYQVISCPLFIPPKRGRS